jgi:DNA replication and repair protein RecF
MNCASRSPRSSRGTSPTTSGSFASGRRSSSPLWDERLATFGARIVRARLLAVTALAPYVSLAYADLAARARCTLAYESPSLSATALVADTETSLAERLLSAIARERAKELDRGVCLVGPHRDDLAITLGGMPARGYASHGEAWSAALALRLGTYDLLTSSAGPDSGEDGEPVLILDDVFAELDGARRSALAKRVAPAHQVVVTAAVPADVPAALMGDVLRVSEGRVSRDETVG